MRGRVLVGMLCGAVALATPGAALGAGETGARELEQGPFLAGDSLVTMELGKGKRFVRAYGPDGGSTLLRETAFEPGPQSSPGDFGSQDRVLTASQGVVARGQVTTAGNSRYGTGTATASVLAGPPAGPLSRSLVSCEDSPFNPFIAISGEVSASGNHLAYVDCTGRVNVADLSGATPVRTLPASVARGDLSLAGDLLASWSSTGAPRPVTVINWRTGAVLYSTPPLAVEEMDLSGSGVLAVTAGEPRFPACGATVTRHTAALPAGRTLSELGCRGEVAAAGDRVAWMERRGDNAELLVGDGTIAARRLAFVRLGAMTGGIDFDGVTAALAARGCGGGADLLRATAADPVRITRHCRLRIAGASLRERTVGARLRCPLGCRGSARVLVRLDGRRRPVSPRRRFAFTGPEARCGGRALRLRLTRAGRRLLAAHPGARVALRIAHRDRTGGRSVKTRPVRLPRGGLADAAGAPRPPC